MKKKSLLKSYVTIFTSSFLAKFFSLLSKIALTSILGLEAMTLFGFINPLLILVITLSSFSLPNVLAFFIAKHPEHSKNYFFHAMIFISLTSLILMIILFTCAESISLNFFHNKDLILCIRSLGFLCPLISISSLIKGYFFGKKEVAFTTSSSVIEEGIRLIFNLFFIELLINESNSFNAMLLVVSLCVGEIAQTLYLLCFADKKYRKRYSELRKFKLYDCKKTSKEILNVSFFMTLSRFISSITYLLEPIIVTKLLLIENYNIESITFEYGMLTSYVMPLLLMPGFFSLGISNYLLPNLTSAIHHKNYKKTKSLLITSLSLSFIIGLFFSIFFLFFGGNVLEFLYHTNKGNYMIKILAIPFVIYYIETPLIAAINAFSLSQKSLISTIISSIIRIISLIILLPVCSFYAVCISTLLSCFIDVGLNIFFLTKAFIAYKKETVIA